LNTTHSCARLLAKPLGTAGSSLTHEVPLRDLHHCLRALHNVEAYRSAVKATVLSVLIQPGGLTHEVPLRDLHHYLRSLHNMEAYRSAVKATVLSVLIQPGGFGIKDSRLRSA